MSSMATFEYIRASASPCYAQSDVGRARCRLSQQAFTTLGIRIGWIVKWQILGAGGRQELCTAWPNTSDCLLEDNHVCLDDSVYCQATSNTLAVPLMGSCLFMEAHAPRIGASIHMYPADSSAFKITAAMLGGLPLYTGFEIQGCPMLGRMKNVRVRSAHTGGVPCLVGLGTIIVNIDAIATATATATATRVPAPSPTGKLGDHERGSSSPYCSTTVVQDIIRYIIRPSQYLPAALQMHGLLLLGPPGVGKTFAMRAVQKECASWCNVCIREVSISSVLTSDNPIATLDSLFQQQSQEGLGGGGQGQNQYQDQEQEKNDENNGEGFGSDAASLPCITVYVLDEVDALGRSGCNSDVQLIMKQYIFNWFDGLNDRVQGGSSSSSRKFCTRRNEYIVATTNCADDIDLGFRRGGRLEREIDVTMTQADRELLLRVLLKEILATLSPCAGAEETDRLLVSIAYEIAKTTSYRCGGYVAADIVALATKASQLLIVSANNRSFSGGGDAAVLLAESLLEASKTIKPAALRGAIVQLPNLGYEDVIGHDDVKNSLRRMIAFSDPATRKQANRFGVAAPGGALLYGPPGNSKTRLVTAVASHHSLPVIALSAADIYTPYVGDAEAEIRRAFRLARQCSPCILFLDEIDAIVTDRSNSDINSGAGGGVSVEARVLATLLTELDGIDGAGPSGVFLLGATNRIDCIDSALLRKGRFHHLLHVPNPDKETQQKLLNYFAAKSALITPVYQQELRGLLSDDMSGADIENLVREKEMKLIANIVK